MLNNCHRGVGPIEAVVHGGLHIQKVVVAQFFAAKLLEPRIQIAHEPGFLVRIFSVAQGHSWSLKCCKGFVAARHPCRNLRVVVLAGPKGCAGKSLALLQRKGSALSAQQFKRLAVLSSGTHHPAVFKIFGGSPEERNAPNINFFYDVFF